MKIVKHLKRFDAIPGPKLISHELFPGGALYNKTFTEIHRFYRAKYGDIVKLPRFLGRPGVVIVYRPDDFATILRNEGQWPIRPAFNSIKYYRKTVRPDIFKTGGLLAEHGKKWGEFRSAVNPVMLQPKVVESYVGKIDEISKEVVELARNGRDEAGEVAGFDELIQQWALESIGVIALNTRLNVLREENRLGDLVAEMLELSFKLDVMPSLYRYFPTKKFKRFVEVSDEITSLVMSILDESLRKIEETGNAKEGVLEKLIKKDRNIAIVNAFDMLMVGIDTTSASVKSLLYSLSKSLDKQKRLRDEIHNILPNKIDSLTPDKLKHLPYLRACMKESQRMYPVASEGIRKTRDEIVLQGYLIPKGTNIAMSSALLLHDSNQFVRPKEFLPERWIKDPQEGTKCPHTTTALPPPLPHPFAYLPFGFGARMCIGKRFAELEIASLAIRMVQNFEISWHHEELKTRSTFVNSLVGNLKFKLVDV